MSSLDDFERDNFLKRPGNVLSETATPRFAWALIPNHAHLLLRTGTTAIATVICRRLTGCAVSFNRRHRRHGHLFSHFFENHVEFITYIKKNIKYFLSELELRPWADRRTGFQIVEQWRYRAKTPLKTEQQPIAS
jgi:hypothetical protein